MELEPRTPLDQEAIHLICQLYSSTTKRDGTIKIVFECGAESLKGVQRLVELHSRGDVNFQVVAVPYRD